MKKVIKNGLLVVAYVISLTPILAVSFNIEDTALVKKYFLKGQILAKESKYKEAIPYFDKAIKEDSTFVDAYLYRGVAYSELSYLDLALKDYNHALLLDPRNKGGYAVLGNLKKRQKKYEEAIFAFDKGLEIAPKNCLFLYSRAECFYVLKQFLSAENDLNKCISVGCNRTDCYILKSDINRVTKNYTEAERTLDLLYQKFPNSTEGFCTRGAFYFETQKYEAAIKDLKNSIKYHPDLINAYYYVGICEMKLNDYQNALNHFDEYLLKSGSDYTIYKYRGIAKYNLSDKEGGLQDLLFYETNGLANDKDKDLDLYKYKSKILGAMGDFKGEIEVISQALNKNLLDSSFYFQRGLAYRNLGKLKESEEDLKKYISWFPISAPSLLGQALIATYHGEQEKAKGFLDHAISLETYADERSKMFYLRGMVKYDMKDFEAAMEDFNKAALTEPSVEMTSPDYLLHKAEVDIKRQKVEESFEDISKYIVNHPNESIGYLNRAKFFMSQDKHSSAIPDLEKALEVVENDKDNNKSSYSSSINYLLADCYEHINRPKDAFKCLDKSISLSPNEYLFYVYRSYLKFKFKVSYKEIMSDIDEAIELAPNNAGLYFYRAMYRLHYMKDKEKSLVCNDIDKSIKLGADNSVERIRKSICE